MVRAILFFCLSILFSSPAMSTQIVRIEFSFESHVERSSLIAKASVVASEAVPAEGGYQLYSARLHSIYKGSAKRGAEVQFAVPSSWKKFKVEPGEQLLFLDRSKIGTLIPDSIEYIPTAYHAFPYRFAEDNKDTFTVRVCDFKAPFIAEDFGIYKASKGVDVGMGCIDREGYTDRLLEVIESAVAEQKEAKVSTEPCGQ